MLQVKQVFIQYNPSNRTHFSFHTYDIFNILPERYNQNIYQGRIVIVGYRHTNEYSHKVDNLSCNSNEIQNIPAIKHIDQLLEKLWRELDEDVKNAKSSVVADRYDTNIQEYKTMAFILTGALATTHSLVSSCMSIKLIVYMKNIYTKYIIFMSVECIYIILSFFRI